MKNKYIPRKVENEQIYTNNDLTHEELRIRHEIQRKT